MKRHLYAVLLAVLLAQAAVAADAVKFQGFEVKLDAYPGVTFRFSDANASSSSPVVISIPGRGLTNEDRVHRTTLQKLWLSHNVPGHLTFRARFLSECDLKRQGEYPYCDLYLYEEAFQNFNMGYASALGWVLTMITAAAAFVLFRTSNRWVYYEDSEERGS